MKATEGRHGSWSGKIRASDESEEALICECEQVSVAEAEYAINKLHVDNLINLRRRTRLGMGTCQGNYAPAGVPDCLRGTINAHNAGSTTSPLSSTSAGTACIPSVGGDAL